MEDKPLVTSINPQTLNPNQPRSGSPSSGQSAKFFILIIFIIGGLVTGYFLSNKNVSGNKTGTSAPVSDSQMIQTATEVGSTDTSTFKDNATGVLQAGGIKGEGTHKLIRDGGPSQTVYLISSVVDLDSYVGKKVQVWGQTLKAKYAGWLMDVGRLKILE
jgi:hypothetical protein